MSLKNRVSPSGPLADLQMPIPGANEVPDDDTNYLTVGSLGTSATEADGQYGIPQNGRLTKFVAQNVVPGTTAVFAITYNIKKNGTPIPGKTVDTDNEATDPVEIDLSDVDVVGPAEGVTQDLISVEVVTAAAGGGSSPVIRTSLTWTPGFN